MSASHVPRHPPPSAVPRNSRAGRTASGPAVARAEEPRIRRIVGQHRVAQVGRDLVGAGADAGADGRADLPARRGSACAATVASSTPASAPRQPAWAAPTMSPAGSANSTGAQSAVMTPSAMSGRSVTIASALRPCTGLPGLRRRAPHRRRAPGSARPAWPDRRRPPRPRGRGSRSTLARASRARQAAVQAGERAGGDAAAAGEEAVRRGQARRPQELGGAGHAARIRQGLGRQGGKAPAP